MEMTQGLSHPRLIPPQCLCPHKSCPISFPEKRVKAAKEHAATRYEIAKRTLVGTKRVEPPVAMAPRDAKAMKAETIRFACETSKCARVPRKIFAKFKITA